ncbi:MAG: hypothetical protein AAF705_07155 [Bacteroidota bacterium]
MWFEALTGFKEESPTQVRRLLEVKGPFLNSLVNQRSYRFGRLETPSLTDLRNRNKSFTGSRKLSIQEIVADVKDLHQIPENAGALFQAASQFNLLEMVSPEVTPERGVGIYEYDRTQGPACAIACGAGTIYRNYFVPVNGRIGQSATNQIDCLAAIGRVLGNTDGQLWEMKNGYALASKSGLETINLKLKTLDKAAYEKLKGHLRIGVQWETEVTLNTNRQQVTQVYVSALPVGYSEQAIDLWESLAHLVLDATYEATFWAAIENYHNTGNNKVFLTLVGGGVFGNDFSWIFSAIVKAVKKFSHQPLDVYLVSYGHSSEQVQSFIKSIKFDKPTNH